MPLAHIKNMLARSSVCKKKILLERIMFPMYNKPNKCMKKNKKSL